MLNTCLNWIPIEDTQGVSSIWTEHLTESSPRSIWCVQARYLIEDIQGSIQHMHRAANQFIPKDPIARDLWKLHT